jgi:uncharacterized protein with HEPN domain
MRVQVAGEHIAKIRDQFPEFFREHHDDTWNKLIAMRNIISHIYSEVNPSIMWDVVEYRLDGVRDRIEVIRIRRTTDRAKSAQVTCYPH